MGVQLERREERVGKRAGGAQTLLNVPFPLAFCYVNRHRQIHDVDAVIVRVEFSKTDAGQPRITLWGRDASETVRGPLKSYYLHRVVDITDQTTGEVFEDPIAAFSDILSSRGGVQPPAWPAARVRYKCTVEFTGPDESAEGWAFQVPAAFRAALDIIWTQETKQIKQSDGSTMAKVVWEGWTEGAPPALSFSEGDRFHAPATVERTRWSQQLQAMTHLVQVKSARPCSADDPADHGEVTVALTEVQDGTLGTPEIRTMTQVQFRDALRSGRMPDV